MFVRTGTVHCNTPAQLAPDAATTPASQLELLRAVSYVCMVPRTFADAETLHNRVQAWEARAGSSHWPQFLAPTQDEKTRSLADAPAEVQRLVGAGAEPGPEPEPEPEPEPAPKR